MAWTKRQLVNKAFSKIGLAEYNRDLESEELQDALSSLDALMGDWSSKDIRFGYPMHSNPDNSDLDESSNAPDHAVMAIYLNLAVLIAPDFGKTPSPTIIMQARTKLADLEVLYAKIPKITQTGTITGAGNSSNSLTTAGAFTKAEEDDTIEPPVVTPTFS